MLLAGLQAKLCVTNVWEKGTHWLLQLLLQLCKVENLVEDLYHHAFYQLPGSVGSQQALTLDRRHKVLMGCCHLFQRLGSFQSLSHHMQS